MKNPILGIIGGGQLGSMLSSAAEKLNIKTVVYSDSKTHQLNIFVMNLFLENMITKVK